MTIGREQDAPPAWVRTSQADAYRASRKSLTELLTGHLDAAGRVVPGSPEWAVRDVVVHVAGGCLWAARDRAGEKLSAAPEIDGSDLGRMLAEWAEANDRLDQLLAGGADPLHPMMAFDVFVHELDIREALGTPAPADHPAYPVALDATMSVFGPSLQGRGLPAMRIETPGAEWVAGEGPVGITLSGHRYDLFRSLTGRRTEEQIGRLAWSADPRPWLPAFTWGPFSPPAEPIEEALGLDRV